MRFCHLCAGPQPHGVTLETLPNRLGASVAFADDDPYANASDLEPTREQAKDVAAAAGYAKIAVTRTAKAGQPNQPPRPADNAGDAEAVGYESIDAMQALRISSGSFNTRL